jgi:PhzF family phenazine biosynthesis protein
MSLKIYQVDSFTSTLFKGNPAAVVPLTEWPKDELLQKIALENNLSETAFYVKQADHVELRWFTPEAEVDLCGHATLAAAHVLFQYENYIQPKITFETRKSGKLEVTKHSDYYTMDFPLDNLEKVELTSLLMQPFFPQPLEVWKGKSDYLLVFEKEEDIKNLQYDMYLIGQIEARGVIVTAPGVEVDFVSRFFGPRVGVPEDPVTGSAHTSLSVYWSKRLNKNKLTAVQLSKRSGQMKCEIIDDRVHLTGKAVTYMKGELTI